MTSTRTKTTDRIRSAAICSRSIEVVFCWQNDRFAHTVNLIEDDVVRTLLKSREGSANDAWPASPAFQQMSVEDRGGGHFVALLVGMAGKSHYSAGIETVPAEAVVNFDIAVRVVEAPREVTSKYDIEEAWDEQNVVVAPCSEGLQVELSKEVVSIGLSPSTEPPTTIRWQYSLRLRQ